MAVDSIKSVEVEVEAYVISVSVTLDDTEDYLRYRKLKT